MSSRRKKGRSATAYRVGAAEVQLNADAEVLADWFHDVILTPKFSTRKEYVLSLESGVTLVNLMNTLFADEIGTISGRAPFQRITSFRSACKKLGFANESIFSVSEVIPELNAKSVFATLLMLKQKAEKTSEQKTKKRSEQKVQEEEDDSWLTCEVCCDKYDDTNRAPRLLLCGHTFCQECLEALNVGSVIKCPNKDGDTKLGKDGVNGLKRNYALQKLIAPVTTEKIICANDCVTLATKFCEDCEHSFCNSCCAQIHSIFIHRNHTICEGPGKKKHADKKFCDRHPDKELELYCSTDQVRVVTAKHDASLQQSRESIAIHISEISASIATLKHTLASPTEVEFVAKCAKILEDLSKDEKQFMDVSYESQDISVSVSSFTEVLQDITQSLSSTLGINSAPKPIDKKVFEDEGMLATKELFQPIDVQVSDVWHNGVITDIILERLLFAQDEVGERFPCWRQNHESYATIDTKFNTRVCMEEEEKAESSQERFFDACRAGDFINLKIRDGVWRECTIKSTECWKFFKITCTLHGKTCVVNRWCRHNTIAPAGTHTNKGSSSDEHIED